MRRFWGEAGEIFLTIVEFRGSFRATASTGNGGIVAVLTIVKTPDYSWDRGKGPFAPDLLTIVACEH
jgi:hypothetical protein